MSSSSTYQLGRTLSLSSCFPERSSDPNSTYGSGSTSVPTDGSRITLHFTSSYAQEIQLAVEDYQDFRARVNEGPIPTTVPTNNVQRQSSLFMPTNSSLPEQHRSAPGNKQRKGLAMYVPLYQAALKGDWEKAKSFIDMHPQALTTRITKGRETALHIAAGAKQTEFVKELVNLMDKRDLELKNKYDNTALCFAAASGVPMIAEVMVKKNADLPGIRGSKGVTPLHMAALLGHRDMVWFLYNVTSIEFLTEQDYTALLIATISSDLYDVALEILLQQPQLATRRDSLDGETALHVLARKPSAFSGKKLIHTQALTLLKCIWEQFLQLDDSEIGDSLRTPSRPLFVAAECGNFEFIFELLHTYPDLIWKVDEESRSIFHIAVMHRQEKIFKLMYDIGAHKDLIASYKDANNRNMLHLAGTLAPFNRLNIVSGAALQMQLELLWFKEVEKNVQPLYKEMRDNEGRTPRMLFTEEHKGLVKAGERWMKDTATSCMLLATLITTVMFAAIFTVPGGNNSNTGTPIFLGRRFIQHFRHIRCTCLILLGYFYIDVLIHSYFTLCRRGFSGVLTKKISYRSYNPLLLYSVDACSFQCKLLHCTWSSVGMDHHPCGSNCLYSSNFICIFTVPFIVRHDTTYGSGVFIEKVKRCFIKSEGDTSP